MSAGWKYGSCARLRCRIISSTPKSYLIADFDTAHPDYEDYIPISQIKLSEKDPENPDYMHLWCTIWILDTKGINTKGLTRRKTSDLIAESYNPEMVTEHFTEEDKAEMEQELDFNDSVGHNVLTDYRRNREEYG